MSMQAARDLCSRLGETRYPDISENDWGRVERELGANLPADYKYLIDHYPAFWVNHLTVLSHRRSRRGDRGLLAYTQDANEIFAEHLEDLGSEEYTDLNPGVFPAPGVVFDFFPTRPGLLRWGTDDIGGNYFWLVDGEPDEWRVVAGQFKDHAWDRHDLSMAEYLLYGLDGLVSCRVLLTDFHQYEELDFKEFPPDDD